MKFKFVNHTQTFSATHLPCRPLALEALALQTLALQTLALEALVLQTLALEAPAFCVSSLIWLRISLNFIKASSFTMCDSLG